MIGCCTNKHVLSKFKPTILNFKNLIATKYFDFAVLTFCNDHFQWSKKWTSVRFSSRDSKSCKTQQFSLRHRVAQCAPVTWPSELTEIERCMPLAPSITHKLPTNYPQTHLSGITFSPPALPVYRYQVIKIQVFPSSIHAPIFARMPDKNTRLL